MYDFSFFYGIEKSVNRFSVWCKENELHWKYMDFGAPMQNAKAPPILEKE